MWWWPSIDDKLVAHRLLARWTSKTTVYFLCGLATISGLLSLVGTILLSKSANQIPSEVAVFVVGTIGFAIFMPWFICSFFIRHMLSSLRELEEEIKFLRDETGDRPLRSS